MARIAFFVTLATLGTGSIAAARDGRAAQEKAATSSKPEAGGTDVLKLDVKLTAKKDSITGHFIVEARARNVGKVAARFEDGCRISWTDTKHPFRCNDSAPASFQLTMFIKEKGKKKPLAPFDFYQRLNRKSSPVPVVS